MQESQFINVGSTVSICCRQLRVEDWWSPQAPDSLLWPYRLLCSFEAPCWAQVIGVLGPWSQQLNLDLQTSPHKFFLVSVTLAKLLRKLLSCWILWEICARNFWQFSEQFLKNHYNLKLHRYYVKWPSINFAWTVSLSETETLMR